MAISKNMKLIKRFIKIFFKYIKNKIDLLKFFLYKIDLSKNLKFNKKKLNLKFNKNDIRIIFIYRSSRKNVASTIMRTFQLSDILKHRGQINNEVVDEKSILMIKNSICILNKSFLIDASPYEFELFISNNNIICLDYIDSVEKLFQVNYSHCLIASSIKQYDHFKNKYKNKLIIHLTHHVDPRIKESRKTQNKLNIGYFGEKENGLYIDKLSNVVDSYFIDTQFKVKNKDNWISQINNYNANYIIRKKNKTKVFKPFLKGFTAAFTSSNVIAYKKDGDSLFYLGNDYPYLLNEISYNDVIEMIDYMKETFGSKVWIYGEEKMRSIKLKCSNRQIIDEFKVLIETLKNIYF